mgnify:CR=1 FL=1
MLDWMQELLDLPDRFRSTSETGGGVIQVKVADIAGNPIGDWVKLQPYQNVYDAQRSDFFTNCFFTV